MMRTDSNECDPFRGLPCCRLSLARSNTKSKDGHLQYRMNWRDADKTLKIEGVLLLIYDGGELYDIFCNIL